MKAIGTAAILSCVLATSAFAANETMNATPTDSWTVTNFYKQAVYDPKEAKIGDVDDVLVDKQGKVTALIISVGGFLGMDAKDVAVPFAAVKMTKKNDKWWLTLDETKDALKNAPGFKYDKTTTTWMVDKSDAKTTGAAVDKKDTSTASPMSPKK